jgi:hypothetical protein
MEGERRSQDMAVVFGIVILAVLVGIAIGMVVNARGGGQANAITFVRGPEGNLEALVGGAFGR